MQELLACEKEEVQEDLRSVRGAAAVVTAAIGAAQPSAAVAVAASALALATPAFPSAAAVLPRPLGAPSVAELASKAAR